MSIATQLRLVPNDHGRTARHAAAPSRVDLGDMLVAHGHLSSGDLGRARARASGQGIALEDVLRLRRMVPEGILGATQALIHGTQFFARDELILDVRLIDEVGPTFCLRRKLLPLFRAGAETVVVTAYPDAFDALRGELTALLGPVRVAIAAPSAIEATLLRVRQRALARAAESRVPETMSSRGRMALNVARILVVAGVAMLVAGILAPRYLFAAMAAWAVLTLVATVALKAVATVAALRDRRVPTDHPGVTTLARSPVVSVLVPLFREREIAGRLVERLRRIDYPPELLDILLVVEESDAITQETIARTRLPLFMRQVVVPRGGVQTKPRALNYALDFCRGSIIGVYDAEDRPAPTQIRDVVDAFAVSPPEVACLQGILDYYNARQNWFSRCFTVEYAAWFRLVLRGFARLGLVVPLGGTTLFFRRDVLEKLGGWDAHNVTEDADLGLRLARQGYRAELIETVTEEEANCRPWPWVKQRSRWLKGYAMTYAVHMRDPVRLWRDLGPKRFIGVQITFLGTLSQFALAPVLWSFWLLLLGLPHPFADAPAAVFWTLMALFLASEVVNITTGAIAVAKPSHRWLVPWVPTLHLYHMLGALAAWKGLVELVFRPFFWDKTEHGYGLPDAPCVAVRRMPPPPRLSAPEPAADPLLATG